MYFINRPCAYFVGFAILAIPASAQAQAIIYVDSNAFGPVHDGTSWCSGYRELYVALDEASTNGAISAIHVADGTYRTNTLDSNLGRLATFNLLPNVKLIGGFAGCGSADPDERNLSSHVSVLSGYTPDDNGGLYSLHVVTATGPEIDSNSVLDGFVISDGRSDSSMFDSGAGLIIRYANPVIRNCIITRNFSQYSGSGGLIYVASPLFENCTITRNTTVISGAGLLIYLGSPNFINCAFSENTGSFGGGVGAGDTTAVFSHCQFIRNTAQYSGGGMHCERAGPVPGRTQFIVDNRQSVEPQPYSILGPTLENCTFTENVAERYGGGAIACSMASLKVYDSEFVRNSSIERGGGAIHSSSSNLTLTRCAFHENTSDDDGGGLYSTFSDSKLRDCTFIGNTADSSGGAMSHENGDYRYHEWSLSPNRVAENRDALHAKQNGKIELDGCTIKSNTANLLGGGIYTSQFSELSVTNSIVWGNIAGSSTSGMQIDSDATSVTSTSFSCVQGGWPGVGNISINPMFFDPNGLDGIPGTLDDDLRLLPGSPCINAGDPGFVAEAGETDLDGHTRVLCGRVDMGAYEFGIGDYNCNRAINTHDFAFWDDCMTGPVNAGYAPGCEAFDFEFDGDVDLRDFNEFLQLIRPQQPGPI